MPDAMTAIEALRILVAACPAPSSDREREARRIIEDRIARLQECADWAALPHTHKIVGWCYHAPYEQLEKSLEDAISAASYGAEYEQFVTVSIQDMEGNILLEGQALRDALWAYREPADA